MKVEFRICPRCKKEEQWGGAVEKGTRAFMDEPCHACEQEIDAWQTTARAVYREAYMAALGGMPRVGMESNINFTGLVKEAHGYALETVRQWPAMMAELDKLIGEMG